ncbi:MAG TPA: N-acetylmuramoyl-L-alanine amidase-like domain-containing protein [Thermodesulfovibrionales bacterium]|nr:N-acetylmuramoyl-L-alanine amidase-like domain-containing protein [Thermodesulfovibrionales bacterium]
MIFRGKWTYDELGELIHRAARIPAAGERIAFISGHFLGIPYRESTLIGDAHVPENLVVDFSGVDCFTFLDYVEAMRMSSSVDDFPLVLQKVRYHGGVVTYRTRNHFFSGWAMYNSGFVTDVTGQIGHGRALSVRKELNRRGDGTLLLEGIEPRVVSLNVIPAHAIDHEVISGLRTGDYAGIYSEREGLDVSHVGIVIRTEDDLFLRHASSAPDAQAVVDQNFREYIKGKPGLIVLRPLDMPGKISACA